MGKILILDFGGGSAELQEKRVLELGVDCEVIPGTSPLKNAPPGVTGIFFSGSPKAVYNSDGPIPDQNVYSFGLPILGICYGLQRLTADFGGIVEVRPAGREDGRVEVKGRFPAMDDPVFNREKVSRFFAAFDNYSLEDIKKGAISTAEGPWSFISAMSHGDEIKKGAPGFREYGISAGGSPSVIVHETRALIGLQFHPEYENCDRGLEILAAFVFGVC